MCVWDRGLLRAQSCDGVFFMEPPTEPKVAPGSQRSFVFFSILELRSYSTLELNPPFCCPAQSSDFARHFWCLWFPQECAKPLRLGFWVGVCVFANSALSPSFYLGLLVEIKKNTHKRLFSLEHAGESCSAFLLSRAAADRDRFRKQFRFK